MPAGSQPAFPMRRSLFRKNLVTALLLAPAALWLVVFLVLPFVAIAIFSVGERAPEGGYQAALTFAQYANLPARWPACSSPIRSPTIWRCGRLIAGG